LNPVRTLISNVVVSLCPSETHGSHKCSFAVSFSDRRFSSPSFSLVGSSLLRPFFILSTHLLSVYQVAFFLQSNLFKKCKGYQISAGLWEMCWRGRFHLRVRTALFLWLMALSGATAFPGLSSRNWKWPTGGVRNNSCSNSRHVLVLCLLLEGLVPLLRN